MLFEVWISGKILTMLVVIICIGSHWNPSSTGLNGSLPLKFQLQGGSRCLWILNEGPRVSHGFLSTSISTSTWAQDEVSLIIFDDYGAEEGAGAPRTGQLIRGEDQIHKEEVQKHSADMFFSSRLAEELPFSMVQTSTCEINRR